MGLAEVIIKFCTEVTKAISEGVSYETLKGYCADQTTMLTKASTEIDRLNNVCDKYSSRVKYLEDKVEQLQNKGDR